MNVIIPDDDKREVTKAFNAAFGELEDLGMYFNTVDADKDYYMVRRKFCDLWDLMVAKGIIFNDENM